MSGMNWTYARETVNDCAHARIRQMKGQIDGI